MLMLTMGGLFLPVQAQLPEEDIQAQMEALGVDELEGQIPSETRSIMEEAGIGELSPEMLLNLSPRDFFRALWKMFLQKLRSPTKMLASLAGIVILCALLGGMKQAGWEGSLSGVFDTVSVLCVITAISSPILDCIIDTAKAIQEAAVFMISFIPAFSAALVASGQAITGATYSMFLFSTCQVISQVVSQTLIPLMGIYLALCIIGSLSPGINMNSAAGAIKTTVSWSLGFITTVFVGLLSIQTMVAQSADTVTAKTAKFLIGSFVPVVGGALSEAYTAAQGCLRLLKTSLGAYGILVALLIFLPILLQTVTWYLLSQAAAMVGDIMGVSRVSAILKACSTVLGMLIAVILCFALLVIVSTTVVMVVGMGSA